MSKNNPAVIVIIVLSIIILIALALVAVYLGLDRGWFDSDTVPVDINENRTMEMFLRAVDDSSDVGIEAEYVLDYDKGIEVSRGHLDADSFTPLMVDPTKLYHARCWSDTHYFVKGNKVFSGNEIQMNKSQFKCRMVPWGIMRMSHSGDLSKRLNVVTLNLTSDNGWFYRTGLCFAWSAGIIRVTNRNDVVACEYGIWRNWSSFNAENQTYNWLPEGFYRCGEDRVEECEEVRANKCQSPPLVTPWRFSGKVDSCSYVGKTFSPNQSFEVELEITTLDNKNIIDEVWVYVFDFDRRWDTTESDWRWLSELSGEDVGSPDTKYRIPYKRD